MAAITGASDGRSCCPGSTRSAAGRPPGSGVGAEGAIPHMVALHGEDDVSIREYRDGDDLRRIHWPATAAPASSWSARRTARRAAAR